MLVTAAPLARTDSKAGVASRAGAAAAAQPAGEGPAALGNSREGLAGQRAAAPLRAGGPHAVR